ncbi:hypothetical protein J4Q44_G00022880 [Coregonus suidteri]|uniref:Metalloendopeptidase n=1 Tax=Coregonus suidteri TaxID=861788 RepID=A0AAN8R791_9TELE
MNAKGIILRSMEQIRLKTCVDFKPREAEPNYLLIIEDEGCYSYVGNQRWGNQSLSIGLGCGHIAIIEHEFLHALGFWHEQSRYDRDDHVTIVWENIEEGKEHNFEKRSASQTSTLGTPYDYTSVMHYGKDDFTNGNGSTIITKQPEYQNVIGQRLDMSFNDVLKLNTLYNCNGGFFMHYSTATGKEGDRATMESVRKTPRRQFQCLQFFYYYSGGDQDLLNIWIREYDDDDNPKELPDSWAR